MNSPNDAEHIVFELIKEYLIKKPFFSIEDIVIFINNRVKLNPNINRNSIEKIIKKLIKKRVLVPGTKLMKNNIIEHPVRNEILNLIRQTPSNINEIMNAINIGSNQALWHLSCLEKFQFVRSKKIDNQRVFFESDLNPEFDELYFYLKQDIVKEIINFMVGEKKEFKITDIVNGLNKNYNTTKKYLKILQNLKLITTKRQNRKFFFSLNEEKYHEVRKLINAN
jgi:predicted transcriptional regulator